MQCRLERPGHADAVLVQREVAVRLCLGEGPAGHQVVLIGGEHQPMADDLQEPLLPGLDTVHGRPGLVGGVQPHAGGDVVPAQPQRHHRQRGQLGIAVGHPAQRVLEHVTVVQAGAHDDLAVHRHPMVEQQPQPAQRRRPAAIVQQVGPHRGVGGMNGHVQRRQALGDHPLEIRLGEAGQGGEVPEQEAEPVVVVLEVKAAPHARWQLVDEAELAVVVTRADPVEHRGVDVDAERFTRRLHRLDLEVEPTPAQLEPRIGLVGKDPVLDHVAHRLTAQGDQLVADLHPRHRRGRAGGHGHDPGQAGTRRKAGRGRHRTLSVRRRPGSPGPGGAEVALLSS